MSKLLVQLEGYERDALTSEGFKLQTLRLVFIREVGTRCKRAPMG
jgi:hypothetical protein